MSSKPQALRGLTGIQRYKEPRLVCIYFLCRKGAVIYVGRSTNFQSRAAEHRIYRKHDAVYILPCKKCQLGKLERKFIRLLAPRYNYTHNPRVYRDIKYAHEARLAA